MSKEQTLELESADKNVRLTFRPFPAGWGLELHSGEKRVGVVTLPVSALVMSTFEVKRGFATGYDEVVREANQISASGKVITTEGAQIAFTDCFRALEGGFLLTRKVVVESPSQKRARFLSASERSDAPIGEEAFLSAFTIDIPDVRGHEDIAVFAPGMIYGDNRHLGEFTIGGAGNFAAGITDVMIREDRLPAPLFAVRRKSDALSLALIHVQPTGETTAADSLDRDAVTQVDCRFRFASLGCRLALEREGQASPPLAIAFWFPGSEGGVTYKGSTYPGRRDHGQMQRWRYRFHPLEEGIVQDYSVRILVGEYAGTAEMIPTVWRAAYADLRPATASIDVDEVETKILEFHSRIVVAAPHGATGVHDGYDTRDAGLRERLRRGGEFHQGGGPRFSLGWCGRNEAVAYQLIRAGHLRSRPTYLQQGRAILDFWTSRTPAGFIPCHYDLPTDSFPPQELFLRELCEAHQDCLLALKEEMRRGISHPRWLAWCEGFADWLLSQQQPEGGFPRRFRYPGGEVIDPSPTLSYRVLPFLATLAHITGKRHYLEPAIRALNLLWEDHQKYGVFVGGTQDNPNIIDKEGATCTLEAYVSLYQLTGESRWIERAQLAADIAETWMYIWEVPMPPDDPDTHWRAGRTTVGLNLAHTGDSLCDHYLAFHPFEYGLLWKVSGDRHYLEVAALCLFNSKVMVDMGDLGFAFPGMQQEHWSLAPQRGRGVHTVWNVFPTVAHLTGIARLQDELPDVWEEMMALRGTKT